MILHRSLQKLRQGGSAYAGQISILCSVWEIGTTWLEEHADNYWKPCVSLKSSPIIMQRPTSDQSASHLHKIHSPQFPNNWSHSFIGDIVNYCVPLIHPINTKHKLQGQNCHLHGGWYDISHMCFVDDILPRWRSLMMLIMVVFYFSGLNLKNCCHSMRFICYVKDTNYVSMPAGMWI